MKTLLRDINITRTRIALELEEMMSWVQDRASSPPMNEDVLLEVYEDLKRVRELVLDNMKIASDRIAETLRPIIPRG